MNNNSSFHTEGVAHCPEKEKKNKNKQVIQKKFNKNNVIINGSCAFVYLEKKTSDANDSNT